MAKTHDGLKELENQLQAIGAQWSKIGGAYPDPDSSFETGSDGMPVLTGTAYSECWQSRYDAWCAAFFAIRQLFLADFTSWAAQVVEAYGVSYFPIDCGDPPDLDDRQWQYERESAAHFLTGTSDSVVAGLRLIFWAAAYRMPQTCRRYGYDGLLFHWVQNLIEIGGGRCRIYPEPLSWVWYALQELESLKVARHRAGPPKKKPRLSNGEINVEVGKLLQRKSKRKLEITSRGLAVEIGCSPGSICKTPAWKVYQSRITKEKVPKGQRLTDDLLCNLGAEDVELARLIAEQAEDSKGHANRVKP